MEVNEIQKLKFRRQYILAPSKIECPFLHNVIIVNQKYILYTHIDLKVTEYEEDNVRLIMLGDIFDYEETHKTNLDILKYLIDKDFESFLEKSSKYSGRYVFIYLNPNKLTLVHDATATRKIFYANINNEIFFSSQSYLLASVLKLEETNDPSRLKYYHSKTYEILNKSNIGDTTRYDEIRQLLPNHYIDVDQFEIIRFWPNKIIEYLPVDEVAEKCAGMIRGYIENIASRYEVMLPVTAGKDSRTLLASTRNIKNKVYYYINKEQRLKENCADISIPKKLFKELNLEFHITNLQPVIDEDFEKIYFQNNKYASRFYLPHIYNYYKNFSDKVNLPGNIASAGFEAYRDINLKINAKNLAKLNISNQFEFALNYYDKWLSECKDICQKNNIYIISLFYWEERMANWATQIQMEKDIAQEEINPFNSRQLISLFLSVKPKYIEYPNFILHRKIIGQLWPELLKIPVNPNFRKSLRLLLIHFGISQFVYKKIYLKFMNFLAT